jgi:hypothetical protein
MGEPAGIEGSGVRAMKRAATAGAMALGFLALGLLGPGPVAQALAQDVGAENAAPKRPHAPAHIRVHPLAQSYPGPDAVRQCTAWLAPENRASGTVIVPKMHCWWERG